MIRCHAPRFAIIKQSAEYTTFCFKLQKSRELPKFKYEQAIQNNLGNAAKQDMRDIPNNRCLEKRYRKNSQGGAIFAFPIIIYESLERSEHKTKLERKACRRFYTLAALVFIPFINIHI